MADEGFECFEYLESALSKIIDNSNLNSIEYLGLKSQHIKGKFVRFDKESNIELLTKPENESVIQFDKLQINSVIDNSISSIKGSVSKILKILEKAGVEASFIEISIFDQKDVLGNKFVTFLFASTFEAINKYRDEMEGNMPDNRESGRGLIVPCDTFYNFSYLHSNHNVDKTKIEKIDTDNIYAFIGNYNPSSDPVEGKKITKYTRKFLEDVLENIVTEPKKSNSQSQRDKSEHYIGIAIPISRPVGLNVFLESKDRQKLPEKLKGGALFVYGRKKLKRLNISKLVLDLKRE